jgi:hypothetical protein
LPLCYFRPLACPPASAGSQCCTAALSRLLAQPVGPSQAAGELPLSLVQLMRGTHCYSTVPHPPTKMEELILIPTPPHSMPLPAPEPLGADDDPHVRATTAPCRARSCRSLSHRNRTDPSSSRRCSDTLYLPPLESDAQFTELRSPASDFAVVRRDSYAKLVYISRRTPLLSSFPIYSPHRLAPSLQRREALARCRYCADSPSPTTVC